MPNLQEGRLSHKTLASFQNLLDGRKKTDSKRKGEGNRQTDRGRGRQTDRQTDRGRGKERALISCVAGLRWWERERGLWRLYSA